MEGICSPTEPWVTHVSWPIAEFLDTEIDSLTYMKIISNI